MTTEDLITYYAKLLILQYVGKPKAYDTIKALVRMVVMDQLPVDVQDAFDIDTAVGVQLNVLGKYVGADRSGNGFTAPITLSDEDYRSFIRICIVSNNNGSSLYDIQTLIHQQFGNEILVYDYANMHMNYFINYSVGSQYLIQMFITEGKLPKPMGVRLAIIYAPTNHFFGFRTYTINTANNFPFNSYTDYHMDYPWLSYIYAFEFGS